MAWLTDTDTDMRGGSGSALSAYKHNLLCFAAVAVALQAGADDYVMQNAQKVALLYLYFGRKSLRLRAHDVESKFRKRRSLS